MKLGSFDSKMTPEKMNALTTRLPTKSAKIRKLAEEGVERADIARFLKIRYQHVRNVLLHEEQRAAAATKLTPKAEAGASSRVVVGPDGSLTLAPDLLRPLSVKHGEVVVATSPADGELLLLTMPAAIRRAQAIVREFVPAETSLVEDLLDDRRREAEQDRDRG